MDAPLSSAQQHLRGRDVRNMTVDELREWINACDRMEMWTKFAKARRSWKLAREIVFDELAKRGVDNRESS